ncbi:hypothetical protein J6500_09050 [Bradyrhizobium sp. WSM 1704]|uniref:hypothetical protein n=1 Tax=Bradyrhizobium semiaridum TaxID=2821404 RepID=UPI001CE270AF|nr:hypothetical protein [Bradyrhizobium semiaridum]MCA6122042.1 hypothetical protein [Bradyrhizobium semiaridum]
MAAWTAILLGTHLVGMFLIAGDTIGASTTVMLFMLFVVALFPPGAHYQIGKTAQPMALSSRFHGPVLVLLFFMNAYYFYFGLNKITDYGVKWVLDAHTELWSRSAIENSLFVSSYSTSLWFNGISSGLHCGTADIRSRVDRCGHTLSAAVVSRRPDLLRGDACQHLSVAWLRLLDEYRRRPDAAAIHGDRRPVLVVPEWRPRRKAAARLLAIVRLLVRRISTVAAARLRRAYPARRKANVEYALHGGRPR